MALDLAKLQEAQNALNKVQQAASRVNEILVKVGEEVLTDEQGNPIVSLTSAQKDLFKTEYVKAKTILTDAIALLP